MRETETLDKVGYVVLDEENNVIPASERFDGLREWAEWWDGDERSVAEDTVHGYEVRTAFFGRDMNHSDITDMDTAYFGTMVFEEQDDNLAPVGWFNERFYETHDDAVQGHQDAVEHVQERIVEEEDVDL